MSLPAPIADRLAGMSPPRVWATALLLAVGHGGYMLRLGVAMAPDSHVYAHWSQRLVESGFDYPTLVVEASGSGSFPPLLYALFATLLAFLRLALGSDWAIGLAILNLAAHVALGLLVVRLAVRTTASGLAAWAALLLFLACFDLLMWVPFVLSDATFVFLAFLIFTLAAGRILDSSRSWLAVLAPAVAGIFYRPTGMVLIPDLLWALYLSRTGARRIGRGAMLGAISGGIVLATLAFAWFMQDPGRWPLDSLSNAFQAAASEYARGEVVSARPETYHAPPGGLLDHMLISADRFVHFFAIGAAGYSFGHWLAQLAFFLPCYALAGWLAVALWRGGTAFGILERKVFLAAFGAILSYAIFHALVQVDFDWRYRTPILPHLILLAAGGLADLVRRRAPR